MYKRQPERVVHARGSAAHGYFEAYEDLSDLTRAVPFSKKGKRTPVFVRFSTVAGERGSTDTAVSYTHLRAHETKANLVCRLLLEKKNKKKKKTKKKNKKKKKKKKKKQKENYFF